MILERRRDVSVEMGPRGTRRLAAATVTLCAAMLLWSAVALAATQAVSIEDFAFNPRSIAIAVGDSVTWTNHGGETHTATSNTGAFDTGAIGPGASVTVPFSVAGTYQYHCSIHTFMTGTITVTAAAATTPPSTTPPPTPPPPTPTPPPTLPPTIAPTTAPPAPVTVAPTVAPTTAAPSAAASTAAPSAAPTATSAPTTAPVAAASPSATPTALPAASQTPASDAGPLPLVIGVVVVAGIAGAVLYAMRRR